MQCVEAGLAVYSPHTAWDAVEGGVNTWCRPATSLAADRCITYFCCIGDVGRFGRMQSRQMYSQLCPAPGMLLTFSPRLCSGFPPGSAEPLQLVRARRHAGPSHSVLTGPSHWQQAPAVHTAVTWWCGW